MFEVLGFSGFFWPDLTCFLFVIHVELVSGKTRDWDNCSYCKIWVIHQFGDFLSVFVEDLFRCLILILVSGSVEASQAPAISLSVEVFFLIDVLYHGSAASII